ncbi:hypothetical protein F6X00_09030 [Vibrio vulnificus]|uniref:hypothetical protein n=1 Tax=Vibrio vulnificus TaxID=672 RepID=UPI0015FE4286|nr:hypothetical protein [Vibrio vulnificus]MCA0763562.1 hypothetical protein [Vibrio vulnificus]QMV36572.1 hypothetical protein F6X00_09030 [Vibrio vulnificus]HAT8540528.1 hypothetical protein [Vibrio vulnificus]HDY8082690.1 hypothetical protein [Vibrio vulnificus]
MCKTVSKQQLIKLEEKYINRNGEPLPLLVLNSHRKKLESVHHDLVDEGDLICHVAVGPTGYCQVVKVCSRLGLFSVTNCSKENSLAQTAINSTKLWFDSATVVVATGEAMMLEENESFGVYKLKVQIQKWR